MCFRLFAKNKDMNPRFGSCPFFDIDVLKTVTHHTSTSILNPDLNSMVAFSSKTVIFSISLRARTSEYSVISCVCSSRNLARSSKRSLTSCMSAASVMRSCFSSLSCMISSPMAVTSASFCPACSSSACLSFIF